MRALHETPQPTTSAAQAPRAPGLALIPSMAHTRHIAPYGAVRGRTAPARRSPTYPNGARATAMTGSTPFPRCRE